MTVEVIVPWRFDWRRLPTLRWVLDRWEDTFPEWTVTLAQTPAEGPWVKALAVNPAVARSNADVIVVADADVWVDDVAQAVEAVDSWAVPHLDVHRLTETASRLVLGGVDPAAAEAEAGCEQAPYPGVAGGGLLVAQRDVIVDVPLDPRFEGWGGEDHSWGYALRALYGPPWRGIGPLWHLWHPAQPRRTRRAGSRPSELLRRRYRDAGMFEGRMRPVVDEAKELVWRNA